MIYAADLFCGAGGSSTGLVHAANKLGIEINLLAVNHWKIAVETHTRNHPWARHMCADLSSVDPSLAVPGGKLRILVASPECTHHSNARGGKPRSDQSRASAWHILHWAERLQIDDILIENVAEFQSWGPLNRYGKPVNRRKGDTFRVFLKALEAMGYSVDYRILNAADYGDATTRRRLFIQARRGRKISWPDPSHAGKWRAAREIIDWDLKGKSIFKRKKPLRRNTLKRIESGLLEFGGAPFLVILRRHADGMSVELPVPTLTAGGTHIGLCEPFLIKYYGSGEGIRPITSPLDTVTVRDRFALCEPVQERNGIDILFRMLQPHELAAAMGFDAYQFTGNKTEIVKQIGNAVPVHLSEALCTRLLS